MKYSPLLLLTLYKAVWICGETALKSSDNIHIEDKSKMCGNEIYKTKERHQRSPSHFDSIPQVPFDASLYPGISQQAPLYIHYHGDLPNTQYYPIQLHPSQSPFPCQGSVLPSQGEPHTFLNNAEHSIILTEEQSSLPAVNHDQQEHFSPVSVNVEPETQLEPPISLGQEHQLPFDTSLHPGIRQQAPLYKNHQEGLPNTQYFPIQLHPSQRPFSCQGSILTSQVEPQTFLNNAEHSIMLTEEQSSLPAVNHDQQEHLSPIAFNEEPETQLEPPISLRQEHQDNMFRNEDSLPPTLCHSPHDAFPCVKQSSTPEEKNVYLGEQSAHSGKQILYCRKTPLAYHPEAQICHQKVFDQPELQVYTATPELNITFEGFPRDALEQKCHNSNHTRREINTNANQHFIRRIINSCSGSKSCFHVGPSGVILVKEDNKVSNGGSSVGQSHGCPGEYMAEENCGKSMSHMLKPETRVAPLNKETMNRNAPDDGFDQSDSSTAIPKNNINKRHHNIRNILSKEQFNELKNILRDISKNSPVHKNKDITEDFRDTLSPKYHTSTGDSSCNSKCLYKLCKCLRLVKHMGDYISDKARIALRGLSEVATEDLKNYEIDRVREARHYSLEI